MKEDLEKVHDKIEFILKKHPETRDSDKLLWLAYMCMHRSLRTYIGNEAYDKLKSILLEKDTPVMESLSRCRRKIQAAGKYQGKKRRERLEEEEEVREYFREDK